MSLRGSAPEPGAAGRCGAALAVATVVAATRVASASAATRAILACALGMLVVLLRFGLLAAVRGLNQAVNGVRSADWEAEQSGGGERPGRVDENDELAAAVLAVEGVCHVPGTAAGVPPQRPA